MIRTISTGHRAVIRTRQGLVEDQIGRLDQHPHGWPNIRASHAHARLQLGFGLDPVKVTLRSCRLLDANQHLEIDKVSRAWFDQTSLVGIAGRFLCALQPFAGLSAKITHAQFAGGTAGDPLIPELA
jgi:hypothetical protein